MKIGEQIHHFRTSEGLSLNQLSQKSGVGRQTIYQIENGINGGRYDTIKALLEAMGYELYAVKFKEKNQ